MDLRQLEYFSAVARHRHFSSAARELFLTQSALSQQVARLESELRVQLLVRSSRGLELTEAGSDLALRAESILAEVADAKEAMDDHVGTRRGLVRVAATPSDTLGLAAALASFHRQHPGIQISLRHGSVAEVHSLLHRGSAELVVVGIADTSTDPKWGVDCEVLVREPLQIITPPGHPLAGAASVDLRQLQDATVVLPERGTALREILDDAFAELGFSPIPLFEVNDPATMRYLVHVEMGVSVVPTSWAFGAGPKVGTAQLAKPELSRCLALLSRKHLSPGARLLRKHILDFMAGPPWNPVCAWSASGCFADLKEDQCPS